ncbi:MAG TPA: aldehyde dehydrogenase [Patescibacteria group bacterium]|nr:aldehyde dehydrogenase [Patescibacteria group bacterium]
MPAAFDGRILNFIGGELREPLSREYLDCENPATGEIYAQVPDSGAEDLEVAVSAAHDAAAGWRDLGAERRATIMHKLADLIEARLEEFALAESVDNGKPLSLARAVDIPRSISNIRFFADLGKSFRGQEYTSEKSFSYTLRQPFGVVATISPWNLPLLLFSWKLAPALAAGNCVIAKPSEVTPMTAFLLSKLANEAGFPAGVLNVIHGRGPRIGAAITAHPRIPAVSFTGGTATGRSIYQGAAGLLKKVSLELGGKNPTIVFDDAHHDLSLQGAKMAGFTNQGQICLCGSRILVQQDVYDRFRDEFVAQVKQFSIADPLEETTMMGAMVSKAHMEKVLGYIDLAVQEGGKILTGGQRRVLAGRCANGYFIEPTVIEGLRADCRTNQEEIFGPVVTLMPFKDEEDAIAIANSTQYGLAASIWTENPERARRVAARIDSGIIWVNCWNMRDLRTPFGGMKNSGVGREGGLHAMEFFTEVKTVCQPAA